MSPQSYNTKIANAAYRAMQTLDTVRTKSPRAKDHEFMEQLEEVYALLNDLFEWCSPTSVEREGEE